jgi:hypothetical protein
VIKRVRERVKERDCERGFVMRRVDACVGMESRSGYWNVEYSRRAIGAL